MKTIFKYQLEVLNQQILTLPLGAEILTVQVQHEVVCLWALVNPKEKLEEERLIEMFGTGHSIEENKNWERVYLSTIQLSQGKLVFHIFYTS